MRGIALYLSQTNGETGRTGGRLLRGTHNTVSRIDAFPARRGTRQTSVKEVLRQGQARKPTFESGLVGNLT